MSHPFLKNFQPETFEVSAFGQGIESRKNQTATGHHINGGECTYTYNSLGFRGDKWPLPPLEECFMTVGCSHTEGVGVNDDETWPAYIANDIGLKHVNFGWAGRSNDYIARTVATWAPVINPKFVIIMYTYPNRREYYREQGPEPYITRPWGWFQENPEMWDSMTRLNNPVEDMTNWYKNHMMIKQVLHEHNIPYIWNGTFLNDNTIHDRNRFDGNYEVEDGFHATPEKNMELSRRKVMYLKHFSYI